MNLNTPFFLFLFLPCVILVCTLAGRKFGKIALGIASLFFIVWNDPLYFPVILLLFLFDYLCGLWMERQKVRLQNPRGVIILVLVLNIGILLSFKVAVTYQPALMALIENILHHPLPNAVPILLARYLSIPLGLSFFIFQALSYSLDVYKNKIPAEKNIFRFFLYMLMFPRVVAGPIVRYEQFSPEYGNDPDSAATLSDGLRRFIRGLGKKVLIADSLALVDKGIFGNPVGLFPTPITWLALACFTLRIYFDFSGYTDMALGLAQMLGFNLPENFNFPYWAKSLSDFWRRWHMTLSGWFRDYVFYPLERKRRNRSALFQAAHILLVFLLTGMWHGVTINFIVWGLLQGVVIACEAGFLGKMLKRMWTPLQHLYTLIWILISWVIFASPSLKYAFQFIRSLFGVQDHISIPSFATLPPVQPITWIALSVGLILATPLLPNLSQKFFQRFSKAKPWFSVAGDVLLVGVLVLSIIFITGSSYQAYIYGKF